MGLRWYEVRNPNGTPTVYQQGTFAPDATYRWMGSIAMDHVGNIALGYSVSSSSLHPAIRFTGRLAGDPLGTMTQGEGVPITDQIPTRVQPQDDVRVLLDPDGHPF